MKKKNPSAGVERKGHGTVDLDRELGDATGPPHASPATNLFPRNSVELVKARTLEKKTVAETTVTVGQDRDDQLKMFRKVYHSVPDSVFDLPFDFAKENFCSVVQLL